MRVNLINGVELTADGKMRYGDHALHRNTVHLVFVDKYLTRVVSFCGVHGESCGYTNDYPVRYGDDSIHIGCVDFFEGDIAKVKEWLRDEDQTIASQPGQLQERDNNAQSPTQSGDPGNDEQRNAPADAPENLAGKAEAKSTTESSGD